MHTIVDTALMLVTYFVTCHLGVSSFVIVPIRIYPLRYRIHKYCGYHQRLYALPIENESLSSRSLDRKKYQNRGKVNEIDFCMAPSDVSLSRSYGNILIETNTNTQAASTDTTNVHKPRIVSLTRALNSVSNRAVRRILLSRSWPSPEALNLSLRQVLSSDKKAKSLADTGEDQIAAEAAIEKKQNIIDSVAVSTAKCPVPRPILNIIMRRSREYQDGGQLLPSPSLKLDNIPTSSVDITNVRKEKKTDQEWVQDQLEAFRLNYGQVPGYYEYADAYLECILDLATTGIESDRVSEVMFPS